MDPIALELCGSFRGVKRNKWLDFGSNPDLDPDLAEVCALQVLAI